MVSRYPGEDAFLGSYKAGNCAQRRFSSYEGFLLPPHPPCCHGFEETNRTLLRNLADVDRGKLRVRSYDVSNS